MSYSALSTSFEYLFYGFMFIINIHFPQRTDRFLMSESGKNLYLLIIFIIELISVGALGKQTPGHQSVPTTQDKIQTGVI